MIIKTTEISISISMPENSPNEVSQVDIVFGEVIQIIYNSSYFQGFNERIEETLREEVKKNKSANPCILCEDVLGRLKKTDNLLEDEDISSTLGKIKKVIEITMQKE